LCRVIREELRATQYIATDIPITNSLDSRPQHCRPSHFLECIEKPIDLFAFQAQPTLSILSINFSKNPLLCTQFVHIIPQ